MNLGLPKVKTVRSFERKVDGRRGQSYRRSNIIWLFKMIHYELPIALEIFFVEFCKYFENFVRKNRIFGKGESQVKTSRYEPLFKCELKDTMLF